MFNFSFPTTKIIGIDLGTPYNAYLVPEAYSLAFTRGAFRGQAAN